MPADIVIKNAKIITMDAARPEAGLVAVTGDRISLVADNAALPLVAGAGTKVIDGRGRTVVPGFNDAHCHIFSFIRKLLSLDLSPSAVNSIAEIKAVIGRQAQNTPTGKWLSGTGFNESYLAEKRFPNRQDIDEVAPDHPVVLSHRSLHACVLNSLALALAGITNETEAPEGAVIERDLATGEPNGILYEMLGYIRDKVMPPLTDDDLRTGLARANRHYLSQGLTSLQDASASNDYRRWQLVGELQASGRLRSRVSLMPGSQFLSQFREAGLTPASGDGHRRLGAVKVMVTQAAGSLHPPQEELNRLALDCQRSGYQLACHAVEEAAVAAVASALEYVNDRLPAAGRRHRIEHCAECPPYLLERLRRLGAVIVTQPPFIYYSGDRYLATVAASQQPWLYRIRSLLDGGLTVAGSSDSPVVPDNPLVGVCAAVTRRAESGQRLLPEEGVPVASALAMYTTSAAYASFEDSIKGDIAPGKLADIVVLSDDPTKVPPEQIKDIKVEMTILGGEVVWEA
jgi:predicted amidohydrolase YtcJ